MTDLIGQNVTWGDARAAMNTLSNGAANDAVARMRGHSNIGTRIFGGRSGSFDNSTPKTFQFSLDTEQKIAAIRVLFANYSSTTTITIGGAKVVCKADWSAPNISSGTLTSLTFGGSASGTIPLAPAGRRGFLWSDWVTLPHVTRTDGQAGSVVTVAAYISTAASISINGNGGSDDYTPWAVKPSRKIMMRHNDGDCITTPANFVSTTNRIQSPIIGIQYVAMGMVRNVLACGDSITDGRALGKFGGGFAYDACIQLSDPTKVAVEYANFTWSGSASTQYQSLFDDAITALGGYLPDVAIIPNYSPNDASATPSQASVDGGAARALRMAATASRNGVTPIIWTGLPTNPALYSFGALDGFRVQKNIETMTEWSSCGLNVVDMATPMQGGFSNGQYSFGAGLTADNIHPSDAGNAVMASQLVPSLRNILGV